MSFLHRGQRPRPPDEVEARLTVGRQHLRNAGAHYTVDSLSEVPPLIDAINERLAHGERP